jgi:Caspase domain
MSRTIYALLVGIDDYPAPIPSLRGCVNDLDAFAAYLTERVAKDKGVTLSLKTLRNFEATRVAVIDGFRTHLTKAQKGDVAVFCYSGHGSQEQAPEEFWKIEPDHLDETLVCFDSRIPGNWDLADKELAKLINDVAAKGPHVAVILDCCHSGSGTREIGTVVRRAPTDLRPRPIETFLVSVAEARAAAASRDAGSSTSVWSIATEGRHILVAACRDDEEAKEYVGDGRHRGALSFFLGDALKSAAGVPTYRDLFARASALIANQVTNQAPQLEATRNDDLDAVFLDGAIQPAPATFTASFRDGRWTINGGRTGGIPAAGGADPVRLAFFRFDATAEEFRDPTKAVATAIVEEVLPASSRVAIEGDTQLDMSVTYKALITSLPTPALAVSLDGDAAACELAKKAIESASPEGKPSFFIRVAGAGENPEFRLVARNGQFVITKPNDDRPLVAQIDGLNEAGARLAVQRLEHIARWTQTARLSNPASTIQPGDVKLTILVDGQEVSGREVRLEYQMKDGKATPPTFQVSMTNNSQRTLFCGLLDLTQRFRVDAGLLKAGYVKIEPGQTAWGNLGNPIPATVPDELWKQGVIEYKDLLKLIVCTDEFDPRSLEQPSLDMPRAPSATRSIGTKGVGRNGSLNRLMQKIQTRELVADEPTAIDDWQATEVSFTTVRPLASTTLAEPGRSVTLAGGIKVEGHPALKANARLATAPLSTRDLGNIKLPRLLYDDPSVSQPLTFTASRGNDPGLSVLELTDVADPSVVTPEAPLRLDVPIPLGPDEHVLPVAYDGEFFLPLGRVESRSATNTVVALDRLPPPQADTRSLGGAIKIFFQKIVSKAVGVDFTYPILGAADVSPDGAVKPIRDTVQVRDRVAKAKRILLFVHGIIGDTQSMVPSVQLAKLADAQPLASLYDLILTFDYENLNTTIEDNGRLLKSRLEAVGLGAGHGKTLDIAAHSMGGLVSRWFIEREGGNQIARRLVMLGTPNGGSPWPKVVDWATVVLGLGLNHLTAIPLPASVVGSLTKWMENPTVALNEMLPNAKVLAELKESPDPGIPYIMLAGNTSINPAAIADPGAGKPSVLARLLARLTGPNLLHTVANPFFLGQENDVAVSVESMENIATGRKPAFEVRPVACDHLSYFVNPAGLKALVDVLSTP